MADSWNRVEHPTLTLPNPDPNPTLHPTLALTPALTLASSYTECSVCLADFEPGETLVELPCAARHLFHPHCAHAALSRSVHCPLCRVDVRPALVAPTPTAPVAPPSPRQLGFTRDGGVIMRYEPHPAADVPRPAYIPRELHAQAGCVEIMYPEAGLARVWRVPR